MSQEKVERNKQNKANRKKIVMKGKIEHAFGTILAILVLVGLVGWAGFSGYRYYETKKPVETIYADLTPISEYISSLSAD